MPKVFEFFADSHLRGPDAFACSRASGATAPEKPRMLRG
jgi:hypothetical protein